VPLPLRFVCLFRGMTACLSVSLWPVVQFTASLLCFVGDYPFAESFARKKEKEETLAPGSLLGGGGRICKVEDDERVLR
jgi:hypothetical protein